MFRVGVNPYGLTYTVGLQGAGTARANPDSVGLDGFIAIAQSIGARCLEIDGRWLTPMTADALARLRDQLADLAMTPVYSHGLSQTPGETLADPVRIAAAIGAPIIRMHLTPVLEGARAGWAQKWPVMVLHARTTLKHEAPRAAAAGLTLAIEDHQDFGSEELVAMAEEAGAHVGIVLDTGNPFAVGEDPVAFTARVAQRVRHVHLKDYRAQFTPDGYRLVRCAIGEGCVPFVEMAAMLDALGATVTASIELAALDARHIRLFTPEWWHGYPPRAASELGRAIGRLRLRRLADDEDARTPWESHAPGATLVAYELDQLRRSMNHLQTLGWMEPQG